VQGVRPRWSWSWWTGALELVVPIHRCLRCAMTIHLPHVDTMAEAVEVVELVMLLLWPCFASSCQVN
jgi:hypothetical protein